MMVEQDSGSQVETTWADVKLGSLEAFEKIYHQNFETMIKIGLRYLRDENSAKDLLQDIFLNLWEKRTSLKIEENSLSAYLKTAMRNRSLNLIRKKASRWEAVDEHQLAVSQAENPQYILEGEDMSKAIEHALEALPSRCRLVFVLKRVEGLSLKEIATQLEISPKTVENQMTKALKGISKHLESFLTLLIFLKVWICQ